jgi:hypothetical protein
VSETIYGRGHAAVILARPLRPAEQRGGSFSLLRARGPC